MQMAVVGARLLQQAMSDNANDDDVEVQAGRWGKARCKVRRR